MPNLYDENIKLSHRIEGILNSMGDEIAETLEGALDRIIGKIILLEEKSEQTKSLIRKKKYLEKQKAEIEKVLNEVYQDIGQGIKTKAVEVGQAAPEILDSILTKVVPKKFGVKMGVPQLSKKRVLAWFDSVNIDGTFFNDYLKKLSNSAVSRIIKESRLSLLTGEGKKGAAKRIQQALDVSRRSAQGLAHNAVRQAQVWGEKNYLLENAEKLKGLRYVVELDRQTCPICIPLDNVVYPVGSAPNPPLHWLCRCYLEPVFKNAQVEKFLAEQERIARIDTEPRTVKHRDGTTSTKFEKLKVQFPKRKLSYNQWVQSLVNSKDASNVAFAKEMLGPTRFKLVKSGKLKLRQLYYAGKLRTIKQLQELI